MFNHNPYSIMFHHFHDSNLQKEGQGSISSEKNEIRFTKNIEFNDKVVIDFLKNQPSIEYIKESINDNYDEDLYINKYPLK